MGEGSDQTALQRRATWVGLRTLRQRPKIVGETRHGEPVFEVKSVRLVLRDEAGHFSRLAECSKCGREIPGAPVMTPADLERPAHSVICKECVRASVATRPLQPERRPAKAEPRARPEAATVRPPAVPPAPAPPGRAPTPEPPARADDVRLAALEAELQSAVARLAELADAGRAESAERRLQEAMREGLAEIRADVLAAREAADPAGPGADEARSNVEALTQVVHAQQGRLVALATALDETRGELQRLAASNRDLALAQAAPERPLEEAPGRPAADVAGLEQRLRGDVTTLTEAVQTLRAELEASLGAPVRDGLGMVVQAIQELARAGQAVRADVDGLAAGARDAEARIDAFVSAVEEGDGRLRALELEMRESIDRLAEALETHRKELHGPGTAPRPLDGGAGWPPSRSVPGELLDGLERQLQEAEGRLARLTATRNGGGTPAPTANRGGRPSAADGEQGRTA